MEPLANYTCYSNTNSLCINIAVLQNGMPYYVHRPYANFIVPSDSPQNITAINTEKSMIVMKWDPPLMPNGPIIHYTLYMNFSSSSQIITVPGTQHGHCLIGNLLVSLQISASTAVGEGPVSPCVYSKESM